MKNSLARDTLNQRPSRFLPGTHHFAFGVDFTSSQTVTWTLSPDNSPTTTLNVNQASRRCGAAEADQTECALACRASQRAACVGTTTFETCLDVCMQQVISLHETLPSCLAANTAVNVGTAAASPDAANWECFEPFGAFAIGACLPEYEALSACFSQ